MKPIRKVQFSFVVFPNLESILIIKLSANVITYVEDTFCALPFSKSGSCRRNYSRFKLVPGYGFGEYSDCLGPYSITAAINLISIFYQFFYRTKKVLCLQFPIQLHAALIYKDSFRTDAFFFGKEPTLELK